MFLITVLMNIKTFYIFGKNGKEVIIVDKNNKVFAFGDNKYGCLGLGHNKVVKEPEIVNELCDQQIIDICSGKDCNVLSLTKSGKCFSWGRNNYGQLGNGSQTDENKPKLIYALLKENVSQICCGNWHSLVLTTSKDLYGFGYNGYGEIGCGNNENQLIPVKIGFNNEKIKSMSCGNLFSLALTDVGHVFSWGYGNSGRLGNRSKTNQYTPQSFDHK
jgi:alpha-tubulin suppressor-like RCC1 family protein